MNICCFSYQGQNLWFYTITSEPFGWTVPESFLVYSAALSVFACGAVFFGTRKTAKLWKRMVMVFTFSVIAVGTSLLSFHLRHFNYTSALEARDRVSERYYFNLISDSGNDWRAEELAWDKEILDRYDQEIEAFEERFDAQIKRAEQGAAPNP